MDMKCDNTHTMYFSMQNTHTCPHKIWTSLYPRLQTHVVLKSAKTLSSCADERNQTSVEVSQSLSVLHAFCHVFVSLYNQCFLFAQLSLLSALPIFVKNAVCVGVKLLNVNVTSGVVMGSSDLSDCKKTKRRHMLDKI